MSNIDYTSVGASFITSAIAMPGMSTAAKVVTATVIAADAAIDISSSKGVENVVTGEKSVMNTIIDATASVLPGKAVDGATSSFNKAVSTDLSSKTAATLTNETKSSLKQAVSTVNSTGFQTGAKETANYVGKTTGGQANTIVSGGSSTGGTSVPNTSTVQPNDAIQVKKPLLPIFP